MHFTSLQLGFNIIQSISPIVEHLNKLILWFTNFPKRITKVVKIFQQYFIFNLRFFSPIAKCFSWETTNSFYDCCCSFHRTFVAINFVSSKYHCLEFHDTKLLLFRISCHQTFVIISLQLLKKLTRILPKNKNVTKYLLMKTHKISDFF